MENKKRYVKCPQCGKTAEWCQDNPWRPFCSQRCKQIDLGAWATEGYRIAANESPGGDENISTPHSPVN